MMLNDKLKDRVNTKGKVYAETWYKANVEYPLNYIEKKYLNDKRTIPYIKIGNKYIELFKYNHFDRYKKIVYNNKLGIEFGFETIKKINIINKKYSLEEAKKIAISAAKEKIKSRLNDEEYIISEKTLNFYSNGSKIIVEIFFSVYEEIGESKVIEMGDRSGT